MTRDSRPAFTRFAWCFILLAVALASASTGLAAQTTLKQGLTATPASKAPVIRLAQTINRQQTTVVPNSRITPPTAPPSTGGGRKPPSGGKIIIDLGKLIPPPTAKRPAYPPPKKIYRPPVKKVYKPKPPARKNVVRRPPPRRPAAPVLAVQTIPQFIADQVTVLVRSDAGAAENELAQAFNLVVLSATPIALLDGRLVTFRVPPGRPLQQVIASLSADPRVTIAQPNNIYLTVGQRSRTASSAQYALAKMRLGTAHQIAQGRGVPVAVIDTGIDASHPAISKSVGRMFDAVSNGRMDVDEHGLAIAGLIAGNGKVTGVAPAASLLAVRSFYIHPQYKRPVTSTDVLLRAFDWSFKNGARIFNMSFAGPFDPLVQAALKSAYDKGIILVAAAGNGGAKAPPAYPAAYKNVIAITALDQKDRLYAHANRGGYLTAAAPGVDVLVPTLKNGYKFSSGTSMAAAHVSGLIALLLEKHPDASAEDIRNAIQNTAHDLGPKGHDPQFGAGRADAHASLLSLSTGKVQLTSGR